jgi:hypothetical protein
MLFVILTFTEMLIPIKSLTVVLQQMCYYTETTLRCV